MNFRPLQCFVILAEELNFSRAAERLHIAQPALSQQIRLLEDRLGTQLVDRARRPLRLTEAGHYLCTEARQILGSWEQASLGAHEIGIGRRGWLSSALPVPRCTASCRPRSRLFITAIRKSNSSSSSC